MANLLALLQNRKDICQLGTWIFFTKWRYQAFLLQGHEKRSKYFYKNFLEWMICKGFILVGFFSRKGHSGVRRHKTAVGRQADLG